MSSVITDDGSKVFVIGLERCQHDVADVVGIMVVWRTSNGIPLGDIMSRSKVVKGQRMCYHPDSKIT